MLIRGFVVCLLLSLYLAKVESMTKNADIIDPWMHLVESADVDEGANQGDAGPEVREIGRGEEWYPEIKIPSARKGGDGGEGEDSVDVDEIVKEVLKTIKNRKMRNKSSDDVGRVISPRIEVNACGANQPQVIMDSSGSIMSPGFYNGMYGDNNKCSWKFVAPVGKVVKGKFQVMDIEQSNDCEYDSVQVWDVRDSKGFRLAKYCGQSLPMEQLQSTGRFLFLYFLSDGSESIGRFSFQWDFIDPMPEEPSDSKCGLPAIKPSLDPRILNGKPAIPHSWPWQVSIRQVINGAQYHMCGGSIITPTVVLTAAHCFFDRYHKRIPDSSMKVVAGDHDQSSSKDGPTQSPNIKAIKIHSYYNSYSASSPYDIAAIVLSTPFVMNQNVGTVCMPRDNPSIDDLCYATGWGDTKGTGDETILNQVRLPIISQAVCRQPNHYGGQIVDTMLCAGYEEGRRDSCQGDSGGPFVCQNRLNNRWYLQGITSWGDGCGVPLKPGVYTRVNAYLSWISGTVNVIA